MGVPRHALIALGLVGILTMGSVWSPAANPPRINRLKKTERLSEKEAEVLPGRFVAYKEYLVSWDLEDGSFAAVHALESEKPAFYQTDHSFLLIPIDGREVRWIGVGVPISLRLWEDRLYLIVFDRETDFSRIRFRYYREEHGVLAEIRPKDFPPQVATQNLWLRRENGFRDGKPVDEVEIAKALDPSDVGFQRSLTARIWRQLEAGREYHEEPGQFGEEELRAFLQKHSPVRLKQIDRRRPSSRPAAQP